MGELVTPAAGAKTVGGYSWQITPQRLVDLTTSANPEVAKRAFSAMMNMTQIDSLLLRPRFVDEPEPSAKETMKSRSGYVRNSNVASHHHR